MTALLPASARPDTHAPRRRPLVLIASLAGVAAGGSTLLASLALGVIGWFLTDAGAHGTPRDGLRVGGLGWLMAHGSGIQVSGVAVTAVPLGLTLVCIWATWRFGLRVGASISGHGPDADRIADGERDWTVPVAGALFAAGYVVLTVLTGVLAGGSGTAPSTGRAVLWSLVLAGLFGGSGIAIGSGRAAIWATSVPRQVRGALATARRILASYVLVAALAFAVALAMDLGSAANVLTSLHADAGAATLFVLLMIVVVPNAVVFSGSYLLGPGFAVGANTLVSPTLVVVGPLPMFPMLAALPDAGPTGALTASLIGVPFLVSALAAARSQRVHPTVRWDEGALRGCVGGVLAGIAFGILAGVAGGAVGPGRMQHVGPFAFDVFVHALTAFGFGGLVGGLLMTWWQRRAAPASDPA